MAPRKKNNKKSLLLGTPDLVPWMPPGKPKERSFNSLVHKKNSGVYDLTESQALKNGIWSTKNSKKFSTDSSPWSIRWNKEKARAQKLSNASEKQRQKINEMLNASQNSQAERDYLRQKILEIFQEDENALKEHEENSYNNNNKIDRKRGYSLPNNDGRKSDSISSKNGHNIDLVDNPKVDRKSTESGFESGSAGGDLGSERLGSRSSVQFIDVPSDEKIVNDAANNTNWNGRRQKNGMIQLNDIEQDIFEEKPPSKKTSIAQTDVMTPWIHQHQGTSTDSLNYGGKPSQTNSFDGPNSIEYGSSPLGFQSIQIGRDSRLMSQITNPASQAWVLIPKEDGRQSKIVENFTLKPINLSESIGSRLKASFTQVNRSTPVESLSGEPLIEEDYNSKKTAKERRRTALIAGTSVGLGAILLASLLVGGTLIATNGESNANGRVDNAGIFPTYPSNVDREACTNYKLLTESWRRINGLGNKNKNNCDAPSRPGAKHIKPGDWYRFSGAAGTHLPTERLDSNAGARDVCGTDIVAWMQGSHPTVYEGPQPRDICFEWDKGPCSFTVRILVQTCYDQVRKGETFYVYQLKYPNSFSGCYWGYCALGD